MPTTLISTFTRALLSIVILAGLSTVDVRAQSSASDVSGAIPQSDISGAIPQSDISGALPQSDVSGALPQSDASGATLQSDVTGAGVQIDSSQVHTRRNGVRTHPGSTINTPTGFGAVWGQVYGGVGYQNRIRYEDSWQDGIAVLGFGVGSPRYVGIDVNVSILDTYNDFAKDRSLSVKVHRRLPYRTAVAVGQENVWHTDGTDGGSSRYAVVSKVVRFRDRPASSFGSMVVNVGVGTDRFLSEDRFTRREEGANVFGSLGLRVLPSTNAIANWTGQDLNLGVSLAPLRNWPLVITPTLVDVTGRAGDGVRFSMSAGFWYDFRR